MHTVMKVPAKVGIMSLIGVGDARPTARGNYFSLAEPEIRVLNFWAENLVSAVDRFLPDGLVQIRVYLVETTICEYKVCIIDDERIPKGWYNSTLCTTGSSGITAEIAKEIYDYIGDPENDYEKYIDPQMYYAKRGAVCSENNRWVTYSRDTSSEALVAALLEKRAQDKILDIPKNTWLDPKVHPMQPGRVVKLWKDGSMWAGYYAGGEKMASCDMYYPLPDPS